ncbi:MAG TPA: RDD family protein [Candidatus Bathyarchaeia archaeon]|nr:RDD family protein [Candidatus Bathyarchaeia archaeon]
MSTQSGSQFDLNHWILRLIAFIIDSIIILIPTYIIYFIIILAVPLSWGFILLLPFLLGILEVLYFVFMEVSSGSTIGKKVLGLQVQTVDGSRITYDKAFIRDISKIFWLLLLIDWILGVAIPGRDPRQKYTDRIAGTTVVSIKPAFSSVAAPPPPPPPPPPPA